MKSAELVESRAHHVVVVAPARVAGHRRPARIVRHGRRRSSARPPRRAQLRAGAARDPADRRGRARDSPSSPRSRRRATRSKASPCSGGVGGPMATRSKPSSRARAFTAEARARPTQIHAVRALTTSWAARERPPAVLEELDVAGTSARPPSTAPAARPPPPGLPRPSANACTSRSTSRCSTANPVRSSRRRSPSRRTRSARAGPSPSTGRRGSATKASTWPGRSARLARSTIASDMQRWATTRSGCERQRTPRPRRRPRRTRRWSSPRGAARRGLVDRAARRGRRRRPVRQSGASASATAARSRFPRPARSRRRAARLEPLQNAG